MTELAKDWQALGKVTPVKSQTNVGACVTFGLTSAMESMFMINDEASEPIVLSEADLHFCSGWPIDVNQLATAGMSPHYALQSLKYRGICIESLFPWDEQWDPTEAVCVLHPDRDKNTYQIIGFQYLRTTQEVKDWLYNVGPIQANLIVCSSFTTFHGDIYTKPDIEEIGLGHSVCVVGFSDRERYWLIKNSWGTDFGTDGFMKVGYGNLGLCFSGGESAFGVEENSQYSYCIGIKGVKKYTYAPRIEKDYFYVSKASQEIQIPISADNNDSGYILETVAIWLPELAEDITEPKLITLIIPFYSGEACRFATLTLKDKSDNSVVSVCRIRQSGNYA